MHQLGHIFFILGILIAFGTGLGIHHPWLPVGLALFGVFVGLVNVNITNTHEFLITGIALEVSASAFRVFPVIGDAMSDVMIFVGGAMLVVAIRLLAKNALATLWQPRD